MRFQVDLKFERRDATRAICIFELWFLFVAAEKKAKQSPEKSETWGSGDKQRDALNPN